MVGSTSTDWLGHLITQNGCIRILSQPKYPNAITVTEAVRSLRRAMSQDGHETWYDDLSIVDPGHFHDSQFLTARQITDLYLLALAVHHSGRLVTFDQGISTDPVVGASPHHLVVL